MSRKKIKNKKTKNVKKSINKMEEFSSFLKKTIRDMNKLEEEAKKECESEETIDKVVSILEEKRN